MEQLLKFTPLINVAALIILVIVTGIYVLLTKKILEATKRQSQLNLAPAIGIKVGSISIGKVFGPERRNMGMSLELANVGNAPAIDIQVDAEIEYRHSNIKGETIIPSRFEPDIVPYLRPGENNNDCQPSFGNTFITHFFDDVHESIRLNRHRIETDSNEEPYSASRLYIYCYYRNTLGQFFKSVYGVEIDLDPFSNDPIPKDDEECKVKMIYIPRPSFHIEPLSKDLMDKEIISRNKKRDLCGW